MSNESDRLVADLYAVTARGNEDVHLLLTTLIFQVHDADERVVRASAYLRSVERGRDDVLKYVRSVLDGINNRKAPSK